MGQIMDVDVRSFLHQSGSVWTYTATMTHSDFDYKEHLNAWGEVCCGNPEYLAIYASVPNGREVYKALAKKNGITDLDELMDYGYSSFGCDLVGEYERIVDEGKLDILIPKERAVTACDISYAGDIPDTIYDMAKFLDARGIKNELTKVPDSVLNTFTIGTLSMDGLLKEYQNLNVVRGFDIYTGKKIDSDTLKHIRNTVKQWADDMVTVINTVYTSIC